MKMYRDWRISGNSEWLKKLTYDPIGEQADLFSLAEFIARENIRRRLDAGDWSAATGTLTWSYKWNTTAVSAGLSSPYTLLCASATTVADNFVTVNVLSVATTL